MLKFLSVLYRDLFYRDLLFQYDFSLSFNQSVSTITDGLTGCLHNIISVIERSNCIYWLFFFAFSDVVKTPSKTFVEEIYIADRFRQLLIILIFLKHVALGNQFIVIVILSLKISLRGFDYNHYKFWKWNLENIILFFSNCFQVTWMSSGGTKSVLHFDDLDNINCLFRGQKDLLFINPIKYGSKVCYFYICILYLTFILHLMTGSQQPMMHFA